MKLFFRTFFLVFLTCMTTLTHAEWVVFDKNESGVLLYDKKSVVKLSGDVRVWMVFNYFKPQKFQDKSFNSAVVFSTYKCKTHEEIRSETRLHDKADGKGVLKEVVPGDKISRKIVEDTLFYDFIDLLCE